MATINKVTLIGYLGNDVDLRYTPAGEPLARLTLATHDFRRDKVSGERKEVTEWHKVVLFGKLGETAGQFLKKGSQIYVEGRLQTRKWTGRDDIERQSTEIIAEDMRMLGTKPEPRQDDLVTQAAAAPTRNRHDLEDEIPF